MFWKRSPENAGSRVPEKSDLSKMICLETGGRSLPLHLIFNSRARRYLLRLKPDNTVRVTIPPGGTLEGGRQFAERHLGWLEKHAAKNQAGSAEPWRPGTRVWYLGQLITLEWDDQNSLRLGMEKIPVKDPDTDLRPQVECHLRKIAALELPRRVRELAARHGMKVTRVTVRNQRSRWGSCSRSGSISLNWRLLQMPGMARDYVILHELAHLSHMNHSRAFWACLEKLCPGFREAEHWIKTHRRALL